MSNSAKKIFINEKEIYDFWENNGYFNADLKSQKPSYSLLMPPPNLTGELHLGHAMQHSILDAVARFKKLQGFNVLLLPGVDHAGIQFESTFDKKIAREKLSKQKLGQDKWLEEAWKFKDEVYKSVSHTWRFLGISADWSREVFTLDEGPRKAVFFAFKKFWEAGLIYKGPYIVQWCPKDNTAIENAEMEYEERKEKLYYVRYKIYEKRDEYITIATVRPETIFADSGIAISPGNKLFSKFVGMHAINPLTNVDLEIFEDKRVNKDFGTGALKITPGHDLLDYEIGKDHGLAIIHAIGKDGKMVAGITGDFAGRKVTEAREKSLEKLKELGALEKIENYTHSVSICERCKSVVEPLISEEWFLRVVDLAKEAVHVINTDKIQFLPKNYKKILVEWLDSIHDWCISRSLWWGHRIPVWYCDNCNTEHKTIGEYQVSLSKPIVNCRNCLKRKWIQDEQVLDTWFSSALWPLSTLGWPNSENVVLGSATAPESDFGRARMTNGSFDPILAKFFPWDFEITAPEIKYLWIARMIMLSKYFVNEIPFKTMLFHGMLRDLKGRKFSKSLGNGIEPQYLIDNWGVDATRMALYTYAIPGRDGRVSKTILDERGKNFRNFGTKLRNIARYILELKHGKVTANDSDAAPYGTASTSQKLRSRNDVNNAWISDELTKTIRKVTSNLESLELHLAVEEIYEFVWHKFADRYIEDSKSDRVKAQPTLEHVLKQVLILLHPFMPFLTEELYQKFEVKRESIMMEDWPHLTRLRQET